jgi:Uma2 family endonuclease
MSDQACLGSDQYVYWNAADPSRRLAPDLFIRMGVPDSLIRSWKTWERGAPDVAVEIVSDSDATELAWDEKLRRYRELGIKELVRFDPIARTEMLRIWDRVHGDLVERELETAHIADSNVLRYTWVVVKDPALGRILRLAYDPDGKRMLPTPVEREAQLRVKEAERRQAAEKRVQELEEELRRRT